MYKVSKGIAPKIFVDIFSCNSRANYDLRYQPEFSKPLVKSVFNRTETISYLGPRIWDLVPLEMKQKKSLTTFKKVIKTWTGTHIIVRVDYAKNMLPASDLFEI